MHFYRPDAILYHFRINRSWALFDIKVEALGLNSFLHSFLLFSDVLLSVSLKNITL